MNNKINDYINKERVKKENEIKELSSILTTGIYGKFLVNTGLTFKKTKYFHVHLIKGNLVVKEIKDEYGTTLIFDQNETNLVYINGKWLDNGNIKDEFYQMIKKLKQ